MLLRRPSCPIAGCGSFDRQPLRQYEAGDNPTKEQRTVPATAASQPSQFTTRSQVRRGAWTGLDQASVMGVELMAAILTWAGIGFLIDRALGTAPWFLAIGALVGNAAGLYLIWLRSARMNAALTATAAGALDGADQETMRVS